MTRSPLSAWLLGLVGLIIAAAMVVGGYAMMTGAQTPEQDNGPVAVDRSTGSEPDPDASNGPSSSPSGEPSKTPTVDPTRGAGPRPDRSPVVPPKGPRQQQAVAAYFVGGTPNGPRLYREFQSQRICARPACAMYASVRTAIAGDPDDPDYRSAWPAGTDVASVRFNGDWITVDLVSPSGAAGLRERPQGLRPAVAALAVQQVLYSAQAGLGRGRPAVQILVDGRRTDQVLGQPVSEPLAQGSALDTLSLMSISDPEEGKRVSDVVEVTGVSNGFEAAVVVEVRRGDRVVTSAFGTADGWMGEQLFPWTVEVDVSALAPGEYQLVASNDDPAAGVEDRGPFLDTRTIVVGRPRP